MNAAQRKTAVIAAAKRLLECAPLAIVSYSELSATVGFDIKEQRWIIQSAMKAINSEFGVVFGSVRSEGYRRLERGDGALFVGGRGLRRIRRASRSAYRFASNAARHANEMTADQRRKHNQQLAALGLIDHLSMARTIATLPEDPPQAGAPVDPLAGFRAALGVA